MRLGLSSLFCAIILSFTATSAYAGAWTQPQGSGQIILTGLEYSTDQLFDNGGTRKPQPEYSKYELDPYLEYGFKDWLTLGGQLSLQRAHQDAIGSNGQTQWGLGDSDLFLRARLWQQDGFVVSAQPLLKLPSPEPASADPVLGGHHPDAGLGFSAGYGFTAFGLNHFADLDAEYRYRFGPPQNQINLAATLGIGVTPRWTILPQLFITRRTATPTVVTFTESSGDDYNLTTLQLSVLYKLTGDTSLQFGGYSHIGGDNTGAGGGVLVALWKNF